MLTLHPRRRPSLIAAFIMGALLIGSAAQLACSPPPPDLTPEATTAFQMTRLVKALDAMRDVAVSANDQVPPVVARNDMRKIVEWHASAVNTIYAGPGWRPQVERGIDELVKNLPADTAAMLKPYVTLIKTLMQELL